MAVIENRSNRLAAYIARYAVAYDEISDGRRIFFDVRRATDVLSVAEGFLRNNNIRVHGLSTRDLATQECNKLLRYGIIVLADTSQYRTLRRISTCFVYMRSQRRGGSSSQRRR